MQDWKNHNYEFITTADGSPSLNWQQKESMHHRGGAYSETNLIYGEPIRKTLADGYNTFISVGLGLGYNELMIANEAIKAKAEKIKLLTYESDPFLRENFIYFLNNPEQESIYKEMAKFYDLPISQIAKYLLSHLLSGDWQLSGALNAHTLPQEKFNCLLYDAFSSKTNPELWQESFLNEFLNCASAPDCVFSTYACTGALKRALKQQGFKLQIRSGFKGKRNSTLALRLAR